MTGADSYLPMTDHTLTPRALTSFNTSSNRLNGLVAYDGAGNLTQDWAMRSFKYDGDNRMVDFRFTAGGVLTHVKYRYDGEGRRIQKEVVGGRTTTYVYNAGGQLVAEYAGTVPPALRYLTPDHLGSTRVVTAQDQAQNQGVLTRHDYLPFGQEIEPGRGDRSMVFGYTASLADGPAQKFTGKERDTESRLDYFQARYLSGAGGRFTSIDPFNPILEFQRRSDHPDDIQEARQRLNDYIASPQQWNRYTYGLNSPMKFIDRDGELPVLAVVPIAYGLFELGSTAFDIYTAYKTFRDPNATTTEQSLAAGGLLLGAVAPGGGYGTASKVIYRNSRVLGQQINKISTGVTNILTKNLDNPTIQAAVRELRGEVVATNPRTGKPFDHITKVKQARQGLETGPSHANKA